ncbi:unnamed protein product [Vitrella brassicaformis CCMP3155]|uniref:Potassium channel tetramerisation-type BTB domain-containing protein n=1 Tax=Vitrella brassicaformis (strain CCMP3155) TaxID=1169540 RepID=A0A0G4GIJ2_VITBC|nr:unnamed protein product [Vitrella brassicaformis CCMP3155]|eukprot:CEM29410.1 unnamed protein product [Vitrella brassicaformis CCMP3155]
MKASSSTSSKATGGSMSGGVTQINVGGYIMVFPSGVLLREGLRGTCVAVLLHRFDQWMLKDADGTLFIDTDPVYFIWLCEKLTRLKHGWVDEIKIFDAVQPIPFYHDIFFANSPIAIDRPHKDSESQPAFRSFIAMMGAFIKSSIEGGRGGAEVLSVTVDGRTVATTDATLADFDTLNDRFTKYGATPIVDVSANHVDLIVDFARRCRLAPEGAVVPPPSCTDQDELVRVSEMYGVLEAMYPNILANDVMQTLLIMIGKKQPNTTCLCKSSLHGSSYASLAQRVMGRRGLLFVIKYDDTNTIALLFCCPVSLFSVCGAFGEGITKIDVPQNGQCVAVAGTEGAATDKDGEPFGEVAIAGGRLWLGCGNRGPTDDILRCQQWVCKKEQPANRKFVGKTINSKAASLCGVETYNFAARRVEVFQVWSAVPADPILTEAERDGWESEAMFKNVGDATDLLLLLTDLTDPSGPIIASHIEGGLTPPADPTAVATTPCAVSLFSVCGAFGDDGIIKVEVPRTSRTCGWRAHKGTVTDKDGDLRSCQVWVWKEELPDDKKYVGTINNNGTAILGSGITFTAADLEIYTLQPSAGWQWVSAVASVVMNSRPT